MLTVIGEALILAWDFFPIAAAEEAGVVDEAFLFLVLLAIPVFAFVTAVVGYSIFTFRRHGSDLQDGSSTRTHGKWVGFWFAWTTALTLLVIIHPGFTGLNEIRAGEAEEPDLTVNVTGQQWLWTFEYEDLDVIAINELVLPVDKRVRFNVTAPPGDVLHSFWIPAFRIKIDAVPGLQTHASARPTRVGEFGEDVNYRVQCAELCGLGHAKMQARVRVLEEDQFEAWLEEKAR